jgi:diguanylate cyclase (GGDEF)-like protein
LTGLLNRRGFAPRLGELVASARRDGAGLAVLMVDLDHFKSFNDRHGHLLGDAALRGVAETLTAAARDADLVARFGGEEFTVVLLGADERAAHAYVEAVARRLRDEPVEPALRLTISAGIATLDAAAPTAEALLRRADAALYAAKRAGRDRARTWDGALADAA